MTHSKSFELTTVPWDRPILAYADDVDIIGLRLSYVAEACQGIEQAAESLGLQINEAKTKLMVATSAGLPKNNQNLSRRVIR